MFVDFDPSPEKNHGRWGEITDQLPSLFIMAVHTDQIHQDWASGGLPGGFFCANQTWTNIRIMMKQELEWHGIEV